MFELIEEEMMAREGDAVVNRLDHIALLLQQGSVQHQRNHDELMERLAHSPEGSERLLQEIITNISPLYGIMARMQTGVELQLAIDLAPQAMRAKLKDVTAEEAMRVVREFLMSGEQRAQQTRQREDDKRHRAQEGARR